VSMVLLSTTLARASSSDSLLGAFSWGR